ncbi:hypothetical protein HRI_001208000 [Hibiscus trionum]|uniref:Uncharacterized protein n=1 Tax=Hibiscus trionum TaxID=183268 RepID=A0A9W7HEA1_HIBTR|nr:hypothetical protein HRI_001208000 [Hibiscus trionum]
MQLPSRKRLSNNDENTDSSDKADDSIRLDSLPDSGIHVPSSDSDLGEEEILDLNHKPRKPSCITFF